MNGISKVQSTNVNPAFGANYRLFQVKLKMNQLANPIFSKTERTIARLEGERLAETALNEKISNKSIVDVIKDIIKNKDYYVLEGFNKKLGEKAKEVYKLL